jgi:hypothetical protein
MYCEIREFEAMGFELMYFFAEFCNGNLMKNATDTSQHFQSVAANA